MEVLEERRLLAVVNAFETGDWSAPSTWVGGQVPGGSDRVVIGQGKMITLDGIDHVAKEIVVQGTLSVAEDNSGNPQTKRLSADWIHVNSGGIFRVGTAGDRYDNNDFVLTLTGTDPSADFVVETATGSMNINNNNGFLMTAMGGRLQFFGEEKLGFTKLATTANAGAPTITVENVIERNFDGTTSPGSDGSLDWEIGDEIVIASSSYDYTEEEVRTIDGVSVQGDQTVLTLNAPLSHRHYGQIESYSNPSRTFDIDMRAEVARLNRTITIQGTQDTDTNFGNRSNYGSTSGKNVGIGAHTMVMPGSGQITVDGVRFDKMGQTGRLGRYPMHWHVAGDRGDNGTNAVGDVMRNSSVTNSNNRGVTVHGTQNVLLEDNVLHDIHGHGFFMEDAAETGNQFLSNIVLGIHKVGGSFKNDPFIVPGITRGADGKVNGEAPRNENGESSHDTGQNFKPRFLHSTAFWITNPDNTWVGNVSAGSEGSGFWFALPDEVLGLSKDTGLYNNLDPNNTNLGQFDHNTSHSSPVGLTFDRGGDLLPGSSNSYSPSQLMRVNDFTGYKHDGTAVYHRGPRGVFDESRFADNAHSSFNTFQQEEHNVLFVGHSEGNSDPSVQVAGYKLYDGPGRIKDSHFAGFAAANAHTFMVESGSGKHSHTAAEGISFEDDGSADHLSVEYLSKAAATTTNIPEFISGRPDSWSGAVLDLDGSLTGHAGGGPNHVLVPKIDFNRDADDIKPAGWNAYISNDRYAQLRLHVNQNQTIPNFRVTNGDGHSLVADRRNVDFTQRFYAKVNAGDYTVEFLEPIPASGFEVVLDVKTFAAAGDATVLRFVGVAEDYKPRSVASVNSLTQLRQANQTSYLRDYAGDLWMKVFQSDTIIAIKSTNESLPPNPQAAYAATVVSSGSRIEAEAFDLGGHGFAFWDTTAGNSGGAFRTNQSVDIQATTDDGGGFNVGWTADGEFLEYTTDIVDGVYDIDFRVAASNANSKAIRVLVGDGDAAETFTELGVVNAPDTGGNQSWQTLTLQDVDLSAWQGADRVIRLEMIGGSFNLNWFEFKDQQAEFVAQTVTDGTRVLVEEFDLGGEGVAYHDTTPGNPGGTDRTGEDVDIRGANLILTAIVDGEWIEFTRDVVPGVYDVNFRALANNTNAKSVRLLIADNDSTDAYTDLGSINVPQTTGYENLVLQDVDLTQFGGADRVFRLEFIGGLHNLNWFQFNSVLDFGDAPEPYPTQFAANGARHIATGPSLGPDRDTEADGVPSADSDADDLAGAVNDEDGVLFGGIGVASSTAALNVLLENADTAKVDAWIDFNRNGVWEPSEKILNSVTVDQPMQTLNYDLPAGLSPGDTFARVRISTAGGLDPTGAAADGEVEDYKVSIVSPPVVESIIINSGNTQRSSLKTATLTFDREVAIDIDSDDPFQFVHVASGAAVTDIPMIDHSSGKTVIEFTFNPAGLAVTDFGSLEDGDYRLTINPTWVTYLGVELDGDDDGVAGGDYVMDAVDGFFRKYGDSNGDGSVGLTDFAAFRGSFGKSIGDPTYQEGFDSDGDDSIGLSDFAAFRSNFGK